MSVKQVENVSLEYFYKENKKEVQPINYVASTNFRDPDGNVIPWKIRPVTAQEESRIRARATETKVDKRTGVINEIFHDQDYTVALVCQAVIFPDLMNADLQRSYGVTGANNLLKEMLDAGELQSLALKVIEVTGLDDIEGQMTDNELNSQLAKNN